MFPFMFKLLYKLFKTCYIFRSENSEMHQTKDRIKREQQLMYRENERLSKRIDALEREIR